MRSNILKSILLIICVCSVASFSKAQQVPCGTEISSGQIAFENAFVDSVNQVLEMNRTFHLSVFIVEDNKGQPNLSTTELNEAIAQLNTAFERIKVSFSLNKLSYIDNYHFDEIRLSTNINDLIAQNFVPNTINIYFVYKLYNNAAQEIGSYAFNPSSSKDIILLEKNSLSGAFLTEQIGHFFNLYHTHETLFGNEMVGRSNCSVAGDLCCDTPADPLLTVTVSEDCRYTGTNKDAMGKYFIPSTANFMSFAPLDCRCYFSDEQFVRMINCMLKVKKHLW